MQGNPEVVDLLNEVLTAELTAVNQYFLDSRMLSNWGYERLGKHFYDESIDEMKDADALIERILYLDGLPNVQRLGSVRIGEAPAEKLRLALALEKEAIDRLNRGIAVCTQAGDNGSRELLDDILEGEEEHADWLESQLALVESLGEQLYLSLQVHE
jgi:bacterioferritin